MINTIINYILENKKYSKEIIIPELKKYYDLELIEFSYKYLKLIKIKNIFLSLTVFLFILVLITLSFNYFNSNPVDIKYENQNPLFKIINFQVNQLTIYNKNLENLNIQKIEISDLNGNIIYYTNNLILFPQDTQIIRFNTNQSLKKNNVYIIKLFILDSEYKILDVVLNEDIK